MWQFHAWTKLPSDQLAVERVHNLATIDSRPDLLHDLEDICDMEDPRDAETGLRVGTRHPHTIFENLEVNDTIADLSGASDKTVVETRNDGIEEANLNTSPDVRGA